METADKATVEVRVRAIIARRSDGDLVGIEAVDAFFVKLVGEDSSNDGFMSDSSLKVTEIILDVEGMFDIDIPDEEISGITTVPQLIAFVDGKINS